MCADPDDLLEFMRDRASDRQLRLFMCACCRRFLPLLPRRPAHDLRLCDKYIVHGEQFADGLISWDEMEEALDEIEFANVSHEGYLAALAARQAVYREVAGCSRPMLRGRNLIAHPASTASEYSRTVVGRLLMNSQAAKGSTPTAKKRMANIAEKRYQIQLLHDIFGNPFCRSSINPALRTPSVVGLAQTAYAERVMPRGELDPERLAILADALEEAGCGDVNILGHLREPGPHVRGCWPLDLVLCLN
jgi:hypothetical protein